MKKHLLFCAFALSLSSVYAQQASVTGPDKNLKVDVSVKDGKPLYTVTYNGETVLEESPLGFITNIGDFSRNMEFVSQESSSINKTYVQDRIKQSVVNYKANELKVKLNNADKKSVTVTFRVSNNDIAFRYEIPKYGETASIVIESEATGFDFPANTTTFITPQSDPMIGWMRTKPSYEEEYKADEPVGTPSQYGEGYTFPCLFHIGDNWALVSETGVTSRYCASHISDGTKDGLYTIAFPNEGELNGLGSSTPGLALPGNTPWRTITVGDNLEPIVETTVPWDVVEPLYEPSMDYKFGRSTWSWIMWQDPSINYDDQIKYIDLAAKLGYEYTLIDGGWETNIGREKMEELFKYARRKGVDVFVWYNSNGYWNDAPQCAKQCMSNSVDRKREMKWLQKCGVKGLKVDFFGSDKQQMMGLYEDILSDGNEYGLMIIFHGCTIPRGWERMYPNYVGSEAVLASENLIFNQHFDDMEAYNATLHPFIRNTIGSMEFGGTLLNKRHNRTNDGGTIRRTTDVFQIATAVLFQNPIQNFAIAPNNLYDSPSSIIEFMKDVPTVWDETKFIDGYPGKYCILARRHNDTWYIVGVNANKQSLKLDLDLSEILSDGDVCTYHYDDNKRNALVKQIDVKKAAKVQVEMQPDGGFVLISNNN